MIILLIVLLVWNIILTIDIIHTENKIDSVIKIAGQTLDEHEKQIKYLQSQIRKDDDYDEGKYL